MAEKPKAVEVLCSIFGGQLVGSHFLSDIGLLQREPNPKDWDIVIQNEVFPLVLDYLLQNGWERKTELMQTRYQGMQLCPINTYEKNGICIDIFLVFQREEITIVGALKNKKVLSTSVDKTKEGIHNAKKHSNDYFECLRSLGG